MSEGKVAEAQSLALHHEDNFFKIAVEYGWHRSLKAALFIRGLMPIHERSPSQFDTTADQCIAESYV